MAKRNKDKKLKILFTPPSGNALVADISYPTYMDTVTMEVSLPSKIADELEHWISIAKASGELPEHMTLKDMLITQALNSFFIALGSG